MAARVKLYAISHDDREALAEFREKQDIPYPLLSDVESAAIRRYGRPGWNAPPAGEPGRRARRGLSQQALT